MVYDITRRGTFDNIDKWISELRNKSFSDVNIILIGNKSDLFLLRKVSGKEAEEKANKYHIKFFETSALDSNNIHIAFKEMAIQIYESCINKTIKPNERITNLQKSANAYSNEGCKC